MSEFEDEKPPQAGAPLSETESAAPEASAPQAAMPEIALPEPEADVPPAVAGSPIAGGPSERQRVTAVAATPHGGTLFFARVVQAVWVGSAVFLAFAALAVFRALGPVSGADAVGAMLTRWHYIAIVAPVLLILVEWKRMRSRMVMLLFVAVIMAVMQGFTDLRIRRIRAASVIPISSLDARDPLRRHFGALHGFSSILLLGQVLVGIGVIAAEPDRE